MNKNKKINRYKVSSILLSLLALIVVFVGGAFSSNTQLEIISDYASNVAINNTKESYLYGIAVEKRYKEHPLIDSGREFLDMYGVFKQNKITFAPLINADLRHSITINEISSNNLSLLSVGSVGTIPYKGHYKHGIYPMEVMFEDKRYYDIYRYVAYISEKQANEILKKNGVMTRDDGSFLQDDYKNLLGNLITIDVDGIKTNFAIQNIYFESNYYYEGVKKVAGEFLMISYYLPGNLFDDLQHMYFMSEYSYQNKFFMERINNAYPSNNYLISVNNRNLVGNIDEQLLISFYNPEIKNLDWIKTICIIFSIFLLIFCLWLNFLLKKQFQFSKMFTFLQIVCPIIPSFIFYIVFQFTKNVKFFSETSTKANVFILLSFYLLFILLSFVFKLISASKIKKNIKESAYEVSI